MKRAFLACATLLVLGCGLPGLWAWQRPANVAITELMYNPPGGSAFEFIELANLGATPIDLSGMRFSGIGRQFPSNSVLAAGSVQVLCSELNPAAFKARYPEVVVWGTFSGQLDNGGERIALLDQFGQVATAVDYDDAGFWPAAADGAGCSLEMVMPGADPNDPANWRASTVLYGTPGEVTVADAPPKVRLNEVAASSTVGSDWLELYNGGNAVVNFSGWSFTDEPGRPRKFQFPTGALLLTNAYLVVWCGSLGTEPGLRATFGLAQRAGSIFLYDDQDRIVDALSYGNQVTDRSVGRIGSQWQLCVPTPGAANQAAPLAAPAFLRINEWYAASPGGVPDWLELFNADASLPVALNGVFISSSNGAFQVRSLSYVAPKGFAVFYADEQPGPDHLSFKLPAEGGFLELRDSAGQMLDYLEYGPQSANLSQGRLPDGASQFAFFPFNATPGAANNADTDADGMPDYWELQMGFNPNSALDAKLDGDGDGASNLAEFRSGTNPRNPESVLRVALRVRPDNLIEVSFPAEEGRSYSLLTATGASERQWFKLLDVVAGASRTVLFIEPLARQGGARLYRVVTPWMALASDPAVHSVSPAEGTEGVAAAAPVVVNFREPIDPASVHTNTFQVKDDLGRLAQGSFRFSADYATVSFHPGLPWAHQTVYEVTLTGGIRSAGGAALASAKQWHFATGPSGALVENRDVYLQDSLEVPVLRIKTLPQPGGYTLADVNNDIDARDDYEPSVAVLFQADQFGQGLTNANGALRQRGQSTRYARQKSYRVELNRGSGLWRGHRIIILNKHPYDLTRMRNKLSFELFQTVPHLTSLRTLFVNVFMDDADYGLFTQIEHPNADFLAAHGLDPNGHLYKATSFEFYRYATELRSRSDPEYDPWQFEQRLEIRGNANHEKLLAMLDDLNNPDLSINRIIEKYFNRENYLTWFAINILTGNLDTASQNFLLYSPAGDSAWYFMPWDFDGAWDFYHQPNEADSGFLSRWQEGLPNWWGSVLHQRFLRDPNNVAQLVGRVASLAAGYLAESPVRERVLACRIVVQPYISRRPDLWDLPTKDDNNALGEWAGEVDRLPGVVANHHALLQATLERPMPVYIGGPEEVEGGLLFLWDASYDLQGDPLAYDLEISTQPDVQVKLLQRNGLATTYYLLSDALAPGAYFFRVIVRDARNPGVNWQVPFESYWDPIADKVYHGVKRFVIP